MREPLQDGNAVKEQYKTAGNLQTRMSIHDKYSVNKLGFGNWICGQYELHENDRILELGCGTGTIWKDHLHLLPLGASLVLTDFSEGMLQTARENIPAHPAVSFRQTDIQEIPYPDDSFDAVIANMMLYHVPNLYKALAEVRRVLRPGGVFYCATYGVHGITEFVQELLADYGAKYGVNTSFTLQNGGELLRQHFADVEQRRYEDRLEVTDEEDLVDYIFSMTSFRNFGKVTREELRALLCQKKQDGKIIVPKEYGMFTAKK